MISPASLLVKNVPEGLDAALGRRAAPLSRAGSMPSTARPPLLERAQ